MRTSTRLRVRPNLGRWAGAIAAAWLGLFATAALAQADRVLVLVGGESVAQGTWRELEDRYGHLAG